ncbi:MAG: lipid A deacylase LpxR family protein [Bacteroidota bacterium]
MRSRLLASFILLFFGFSFNCLGQTFKNEFGFKSDNDAYLLYGQDRYYTNGLFIYFRHAANQQKLGPKLEKFIYEVSAGQKMYNPISGNVGKKEKQDRPFAGYLYAGGSASFFYKKESVLKTNLELGTIGPDALGEEAQKLLHQLIGFYEINGWQYQIKNELTANLNIQYTKLLHRSAANNLDFSVETYLNAGTTFNGAGVGLLLRTGDINQLFNSSYTNAVIGNKESTARLVKKELFFYIKPQLNYVAYDATIQGSLFNNDSPLTFGTKPFVFAQQLGFNVSSSRFTFDFSLLFKSKEIKSTAKAHQYGSISMYYRFN